MYGSHDVLAVLPHVGAIARWPVPLVAKWVPYGRPAVSALSAVIAATKADDPLSPVTVVVPSNEVGVALRRLLASDALFRYGPLGTGIAAVSFLTLHQLAESLGAGRLAAGRRPATESVVAAALRGALALQPGIFAPVRGHVATEVALAGAYRELRDLPSEALDLLAGVSRRAGDVVRLCRGARERLKIAFYDDEDLLDAAAEAVVSMAEQSRAEIGTVAVYLPQLLSLHEASLLSAIGRHGDLHVIAGTTGIVRADAHVAASVRRLREAGEGPGSSARPSWPADVEAGLQPSSTPPPPTPPPPAPSPPELQSLHHHPLAPEGGSWGLRGASGHTGIVTASDADEEVRIAVRAVIDAARSGVPLDRIAVLYGTEEPYARIVHAQMDSAGIIRNGVGPLRLSSGMAGRTILGLLSMVGTGMHRSDLFAWLSGSRVVHQERLVPLEAWERISRDAGVVAGLDQWDKLLEGYARDCERPGAAADARALRSFVLGLAAGLASAAARVRRWSEHSSWALSLLTGLLGGEGNRAGWPDVERLAAERVERVIEQLAGLDLVEGPVALDVFAGSLRLELEAKQMRVGSIGKGILCGRVDTGAGLDVDLVIVLGLAEGTFPATQPEDYLLSDGEREAAGGALASVAGATECRHHDLLATLAGAGSHLLCVPRGDLRRNGERYPSRFLAEIAAVPAGEEVDLGGPAGGGHWLRHVASFGAGLQDSANPATAQEYRLRALIDAGSPRQVAAAVGGSLADPVLAAGAAMLVARRSERFTRFDGNLAGLAVPSPATKAVSAVAASSTGTATSTGVVTSATRLSRWAVCPFAYFAREILRIEPVENPEDRVEMSPLDLGRLVHEILERFIREAPAPVGGCGSSAPGERWSGEDASRLRSIAQDICEAYDRRGLTGRPAFWHRDRRRVMAVMERFIREDSDRLALHCTRPLAAELAFGLPGGEVGAVELPLPDGRRVMFHGVADRLDATGDGELEVIDYKTGRDDDYRGLSETDPDGRGTKLQLPVYALAARLYGGNPQAVVRSYYWFVSSSGGFRYQGYEVTSEVLSRVGGTVGRMVAGIEAGVFPMYQRKDAGAVSGAGVSGAGCPYCASDALGPGELRRQLVRKREDPGLAAFLELSEGADGEADRPVGEVADV